MLHEWLTQTHNVPDERAKELIASHTPTQIEIGFRKESRYTGDEIAGIILKGKYGKMRGLSSKNTVTKYTAPEMTAANPTVFTPDNPGGEKWQDMDKRARKAYLQALLRS